MTQITLSSLHFNKWQYSLEIQNNSNNLQLELAWDGE